MWDLSDNFTNKEGKGHHLMDAHNLEGTVLSIYTMGYYSGIKSKKVQTGTCYNMNERLNYYVK